MKMMKRLLAAAAVTAMFVTTLGGMAGAAPQHSLIKVQPTNRVNVYQEPSYLAEPIATLQSDDSVLIQRFADELGWLEIYWNGGLGYIHAIDLRTVGTKGEEDQVLYVDVPEDYRIGDVKSAAVVYDTDGAGKTKMGALRKGAYCVIVGETDSNYVILYGDQNGYVAKKSVGVAE